MERILLVEDDAQITASLSAFLQSEGFSVETATGETRARQLVEQTAPGLLLVDVQLAEGSGFGVCAYARSRGLPVIFLTASGDESSVVLGLDMGADDYIVKPFEMKEVLARIHAVLRRTGQEEEQGDQKLSFDKLVINLDSYELLVDGKRVDTPPKELELLYHLASAPNRVFTRNQLLDEVWGFDYFGDSRTVDVHIKRLREKIENVSDQWELKTVWGVGYKFDPDTAQ